VTDVGRYLFRCRELELELQQADAMIDVLKGALAAETVEAIGVPQWAKALAPQHRAIMGALVAKFPHYMTREALDSCIPHQDHTVACHLRMIDVLVCRVRKILGPDTFEALRGAGYRVSPEFMARIAEPAHGQ
jgi:DNA-binding response OmpR family regulator